MPLLTNEEKEFLQRLADYSGDTIISGDKDHRPLARLVKDKYVTRHLVNLETIIYTITDDGKKVLAETTKIEFDA